MSERKLKIAALLKELYDMAEVPVPSSRIPFYFNDVRAGHIERTDAEFLAKTFRFCEARPDAFVFTAEGPGQASRRLAAVSHLYKGADKVFAWRDELLSVTASDDIACESPLTVIERAMCRPFAFNTFAVHLNPFTRDGRMWVAQRSFKKAIGPGYWDNCAAGLVGAGEPFGLAMEREAFEEACVAPGSIEISFSARNIISRPVHEGWMREIAYICNAYVEDSFHPHNMDGEVECFELLEPEAIIERIEKGRFTFESSLAVLAGLAWQEGLLDHLDQPAV